MDVRKTLGRLTAGVFDLWRGNNPPEPEPDIPSPQPAKRVPPLQQPSFWNGAQASILNLSHDDNSVLFALLSKLLACNSCCSFDPDEREEAVLNKLFSSADADTQPVAMDLQKLLEQEKLYALITMLHFKEMALLLRLKVSAMSLKCSPSEARESFEDVKAQYLREAKKRKIYLGFLDRTDRKTAVFELSTNLSFALHYLPDGHRDKIFLNTLFKATGSNSGVYANYAGNPYHLQRLTKYERVLERGFQTGTCNPEGILGKSISYETDGLIKFIRFQSGIVDGIRHDGYYRGYLLNEAAAKVILEKERARAPFPPTPSDFSDIMDIYDTALNQLSA